jgi:hypothetical protein
METPTHHPPPLFVVGCGRSGTTVLRLMLNAHPDLAIPPEAQFIERLAARRDRYVAPDGGFAADGFLVDLLTDRRFKEWGVADADVCERIPASGATFAGIITAAFESYAAAHGKLRWGDKTPDHVRYMSLLGGLWPEGKFVHLIRDGRDVAGSLAHTPFGPKTVLEQARYWAKRVRAGRRAGAALGPSRYLEVRYESLVGDLEAELRRICSFAGLTFEPAMLRHHERSVGTIPPSEIGHQAGALEPLRPGIRDWRIDMPARDVAVFGSAEGRLLDELGYPHGGGFVPAAWATARFADVRESVDLRRRVRRTLGRTKARS